MNRKFIKFEEIESDLLINAPGKVYKYRTWADENRKNLLKEQQIWFSHPFDLNDPLDIRPETVFDPSEIEDQRYLQKLLNSVASERSHLVTEYDRRTMAENQWEITKSNPSMIVENHKVYMETREHFDKYGIFSTGMNDLSEDTWGKYGDNHAGYCIGFKTVELCRQMKSGYGYVTYSDDPYHFSFFEKDEDSDLDRLYLKKTSWQYEEEFRFITLGIGTYSTRLQYFKVNTVTEMVLGYNITPDDENEIRSIINVKYPKEVPVFKTKRNKAGKLEKEQIQ